MSDPYADAADVYWAAGWRGVLPLPFKAKKNPPAGYTGSTGTDPAYPDVAAWSDRTGDPHNICLRMPDSVIGIDVDAYGDKAGAITLHDREQDWGPLPPTWRSTSRDDGISGIRLYRVPPGLAWPGEVGPGIETVRRDHRYVVAWPSIHPDTGKAYRWVGPDGVVAAQHVPDPDTLPFLPDEWVQGLTGGEAAPEVRRNTLQNQAAMLWIASLPESGTPMPCKRMDTACDAAVRDLGHRSAHDTALAGIARILRLGDEGHTGTVTAVVKLRDAFIAEVTRPSRALADKTIRTKDEARREWDDMLVSGVNLVSADPLAMPSCDCDGIFSEQFVAGATGNEEQSEEEPQPTPEEPAFPQLTDGASFILNAPEMPVAIWGFGDEVLWAEGESLMVVGSPGVGKTTLCGQILRGILIPDQPLLGHGFRQARRVLYLAMDRPAQIARSLRRHFSEDDREILADRLRVWQGPPPGDVAKNTSILVNLAKLADADVVIVDSVKDAAIGLTDDETAAAYNQARQKVLAAGVQFLELHHLVKRGPNGAKPRELADVYGSTWLTSGAGSVILLWGVAGDMVVEMLHLKQPAEPIGPLFLTHDHAAGRTTIYHDEDHVSLIDVVRASGVRGITAAAAFKAMHDSDPIPNEKKSTERALGKLVDQGLARVEKGHRGGGQDRQPTRWFAVAEQSREQSRGHQYPHSSQPQSNPADGDFPHESAIDTSIPQWTPEQYPSHLAYKATGGIGMGGADDIVRACEDCGKDTGSEGFIICSDCEKKRRSGA